jgi:hypothetical protein
MILRACIIAALSFAGAVSAFAQTPGTIPGNKGGLNERPASAPEAASGLNQFYLKFGRYQTSVSAAGSNAASHTLRVTKPHADAIVDKAYLMAASNGCGSPCSVYTPTPINNGDIRLNNQPVTWQNSVINGINNFPEWFHSVLADVTSIVKPVMDAMPAAGNKNFTVKENSAKNLYIDGEILVVVFKMPAGNPQRTVALMFGAQQLHGDRFELSLLNPIDKTAAGAALNMGLGISYGFQDGGVQQFSRVTVNGQALTSAAGGSDDSVAAPPGNGTLITVGGLGDSLNKPADPNATPTTSRSDDERYSLLSFINNSTTLIQIDTHNPSNDDNIFFAYFEFSGRGDVNKDSDGDGLLDSWEESGYDHDGDGTIDVDLPALGFNKNKKDIAIAYAYMAACSGETKSHRPLAAVLNPITQAFARAPVSNPNGTKGIKLHWKNLGMIPCTEDLDLTAQNWAPFDTIMDPRVSPAERVIYHRMISGRRYDGGNSSGLSRGIGASDFVETLHSDTPAGPRAGTIMHELGHNLGLRHGNIDHDNYKPNHLSIMSYSNQFDWLLKGGNPFLDYERFELGSLNERALNEAAGLNNTGAGGDAAISTYGVRWFTAGNGRVKNTGANTNVNWNNTGAANQNPVAVDINNGDGNPNLRTTLVTGQSEWENIVYDGGQIGAGKTARERRKMLPLPPNALKEQSYEEHLERTRNVREVQ